MNKMLPKQDRIKPRTAEDLERKYNFEKLSKLAQPDATRNQSQNDKKLLELEDRISRKVGNNEYSRVVRMLNASDETVRLASCRLEIAGDVKEYDAEQQSIELLRFSIGESVYGLRMRVQATGDLGLSVNGFFVEVITQ